MAIDTKNKRRSAYNAIPLTLAGVPEGIQNATDRVSQAWLYSGLVDDTAAVEPFSREPTFVVSFAVPGDLVGTQTFLFSPKLGRPLNLILEDDIRPYIMEVDGRPTRVQPDQAGTERANITITLADDGDQNKPVPDFDSTVFSVFTGGSFLQRLLLAQPDLVGTRVEVKRGFIVPGVILTDFDLIFRGRIEDWNVNPDRSIAFIVKDDLALQDRSVPAQLSDNNLINGALIASSATITIDDAQELTDPANLDYKDAFPVVLRLDPDGDGNGPEDVTIKSISGNVLTVQDNFLNKSEAFEDATWVKTGGVTVTADQGIGPFGGPVKADEINFAATTDRIEQDSVEAASGIQFTGSVWLRGVVDTSIPLNPPYTMTLDLILSDASELASVQVTVTKDWQRFQLVTAFTGGAGQTAVLRIRRDTSDGQKVLAYGAQLEKSSTRGFYAATDTNKGADAGRGAFGSTADTHVDDTKILEVILYRLHLTNDGVHGVVILRDLVNRGLIPSADVDQASFDNEFAFEESPRFRRSGDTLIKTPRKLAEHIKELRESALLDLWMSEDGKAKTRLSFRQNDPSLGTFTIKDEENIVRQTASYKGNKESRITRALVYFNPVAGETDPSNPDDFQNVQVTVDLGVEALSGEKSKEIFSKWIFRSNEGIALSGRLISRFRRGARIASWSLDMKDSNKFFVGDVISLDSDDVLQKSGSSASRGNTLWQVIHKEHQRDVGRVRTEGLEASGRKYGIISPDLGLEDTAADFPDFDDASTAERQYGFVGTGALGDSETTVGTPSQDGYYIL